MQLVCRTAVPGDRDFEAVVDQIDGLVFEPSQVRFPQDREQVLALAPPFSGTLDHAEEAGEFFVLDARKEGHFADTILEKQEGKRIGAALGSIDLFAADRETLLLDPDHELVHVRPQISQRLAQALDEALVDRIVLVVELDRSDRFREGDEQLLRIRDRKSGFIPLLLSHWLYTLPEGTGSGAG